MARATIWIEDGPNGTIEVGGDFGDAIEDASQAHQMGKVLLNSILVNAKTYTTVEDTAPEHNVEPTRIITPTNSH